MEVTLIVAILVALSWVFFLIILFSRLYTRSAILTLEDAIVLPGEKVELIAWLERAVFLFVDPDLRGEKIEFHSESGLLGTAETDATGHARWTVGGLPPGLHRFRARLARPGFRAADPEAIVAVWPAEAPVLITDIDRTIAGVSSFRFIFVSNRAVRPVEGAPETLRDLARDFRILYLSARDHIFLNKTRSWLRLHGFPEGPLLQRRVRFTKATPYEHKMERLRDVVARLKNIRFGVGDLPGDARAYANHGLRPIYLSPLPPLPGLPDGTIIAKTWAGIADLVRGEMRRSGEMPG